ncbi:hypothetical protein FCULG_00002058 [Fusarium culmorum]|uniref:Uncharacterized protein n=1 Tax=Fusarium culmorum TaxID=5516 RepID=A0A2T4GK93_FUSCU|nr:hypothetical protein FCULG_00002058 [Fusarium culmorum]
MLAAELKDGEDGTCKHVGMLVLALKKKKKKKRRKEDAQARNMYPASLMGATSLEEEALEQQSGTHHIA